MGDNVSGTPGLAMYQSFVSIFLYIHGLENGLKWKWWRTMQVTKETYSLSQNQAMELDAP